MLSVRNFAALLAAVVLAVAIPAGVQAKNNSIPSIDLVVHKQQSGAAIIAQSTCQTDSNPAGLPCNKECFPRCICATPIPGIPLKAAPGKETGSATDVKPREAAPLPKTGSPSTR